MGKVSTLIAAQIEMNHISPVDNDDIVPCC